MADNKNPRKLFQQPEGAPKGGPRRWLSILFYTLAFALMGYYFFTPKDNSGVSKDLTYTKLKAYIEVGAIEKSLSRTIWKRKPPFVRRITRLFSARRVKVKKQRVLSKPWFHR